MRYDRFPFAVLAVLCVFPLDGRAQSTGAASPMPAGSALVATLSDSAVLAQLEVRNLGPAVMSGRISDIAVPLEAGATPGVRLGRVMYVASAGGGVWKTTNGGKAWQPLFDQQGAASIGAVAVAPSNPDIVWVGTGESNNLRSSSWGDGVYKSMDGGATWLHMGLRASQHIGRIVIHPTDPDVVYVAATGRLWGSGGERGLFRTTDGGRSWRNIKAINETTGFTDVVLDPSNPDIIYAAAYQRQRKAYSFVAGGPSSGLWKSMDGGATWRELTDGIPATDKGRIGISVSASQPGTLYAVIHADSGGVFRTDDGGATWRRASNISSIPWFFGQIRVDPTNVDRVYFLGVQLQVSEDGAQTWRTIAQRTHADHHAMWIDPHDSNHLVIGNDGGLFISYDRGETWDFSDNLPVSTFYAIAADMREPFYWVYGGLQDNGSWGGPVQTRLRSGITNSDWVRAGGGDGFHAAIDPEDENIVYVESQNGALRRFDLLTQEGKSIRPPAVPGEPALRYNWSAPLLLSPHDSRTLYFGANHLFRSTDRGDTWERLGGDLTRQLNRDTLPIMGLREAGGLGRHAGTAPFGNLSTIDESKLRAGLIYTGSDDGLVHVSLDGGRSWTRYEAFPGVPELTYVSRIVASRHHEGTVYTTFDGHRDNDFKPYVLRSTDYGRTWTSIASNLPDQGSVRVIREHHRNRELLFVGTEFGVFVTVNGGRWWTRLASLPTVAVHDLVIHPRENDLLIGTHGRGIWVLDDIAPLERLADAGQARVAHVFPARPGTIYNLGAGPLLPGDRGYFAMNPPRGLAVTYLVQPGLAEEARATLAIVDAEGRIVRELSAATGSGVHRVTWDLRFPPPDEAPASRIEPQDEAQQAPSGPVALGPYVMPGSYRVQYRIHSVERAPAIVHEAQLQVRRDPLVRLTDAQYAELHEWRMRAYWSASHAARAVRELEDTRSQLELAIHDARSLADDEGLALLTEVEDVLVKLRGVRRTGPRTGGGFGGAFGAGQSIQQRAQSALGEIASLHFTITEGQKQTIEQVTTELDQERQRIEAVRVRLPEVLRSLGAAVPDLVGAL